MKYSMKISVFWLVALCRVADSCDGSKKGQKVQADPEDEGTLFLNSWQLLFGEHGMTSQEV